MLVCPRCHRANPGAAAFCYFDGAPLSQGSVTAAPAAKAFPEFVFTSGRRCQTLEEFAAGCRDEWSDARELLSRGVLGRYLANAGRADLAGVAGQAQTFTNPDAALLEFLGNLPAPPRGGQVPRLGLDPRRVVLSGNLHPGDQKKIHVLIVNQGGGLLQGRLTVADDTPWLRLADADGSSSLAIQAARHQQINMVIDTRGLVGGQTFTSKLTIITNGGVAELPIRMDLGATLFAHPPFKGAATQRQLAERMRGDPKAAVPLLENGTVRKWFHANGWNYPIAGASAHGIGAVQQFFECLGLSKPPALELSEKSLLFDCRRPGVQAGSVTLRTSGRKWVYAEVESNVPWLTVLTPSVSGAQQAVINFEVDGSQLTDSRVYEAALQIRANGGKRLELPIQANALRPKPSVVGMLTRPIVALALVFMIGRLVLAIPGDLFARLIVPSILAPSEEASAEGKDRARLAEWLDPGDHSLRPGSLDRWRRAPGSRLKEGDPTSAIVDEGFLKLFVLATAWVGALVGLRAVWRRRGSLGDLFGGFLAGGGAGLASCATLGCLLLLGDGLPRYLVGRFAGISLSVVPATLLWLALVAISYCIWGVLAGIVLAALGRTGRRIQAMLAAPLAGLVRLFGAVDAAEFLAPQR